MKLACLKIFLRKMFFCLMTIVTSQLVSASQLCPAINVAFISPQNAGAVKFLTITDVNEVQNIVNIMVGFEQGLILVSTRQLESLDHILSSQQNCSTHNGAAFSSDYNKNAYGYGNEIVIKIYKENGWALESQLSGHTDTVNSVCFSFQGDRIVSGSSDGTIRVWSKEQDIFWTEIGASFSESGKVHSVAFISNNSLISTSVSGTIQLWQLNDNGTLLEENSYQHDCRLYISYSEKGILALGDDEGFVFITKKSSDNNMSLWDFIIESVKIRKDFK